MRIRGPKTVGSLLRGNAGFTLIEAVFSGSILVVVAAGVYTVTLNYLKQKSLITSVDQMMEFNKGFPLYLNTQLGDNFSPQTCEKSLKDFWEDWAGANPPLYRNMRLRPLTSPVYDYVRQKFLVGELLDDCSSPSLTVTELRNLESIRWCFALEPDSGGASTGSLSGSFAAQNDVVVQVLLEFVDRSSNSRKTCQLFAALNPELREIRGIVDIFHTNARLGNKRIMRDRLIFDTILPNGSSATSSPIPTASPFAGQ